MEFDVPGKSGKPKIWNATEASVELSSSASKSDGELHIKEKYLPMSKILLRDLKTFSESGDGC